MIIVLYLPHMFKIGERITVHKCKKKINMKNLGCYISVTLQKIVDNKSKRAMHVGRVITSGTGVNVHCSWAIAHREVEHCLKEWLNR